MSQLIQVPNEELDVLGVDSLRVEERGKCEDRSERDGREMWVCDGAVWGNWRRGRWVSDTKRTKVALDRVRQALAEIPPKRRSS